MIFWLKCYGSFSVTWSKSKKKTHFLLCMLIFLVTFDPVVWSSSLFPGSAARSDPRYGVALPSDFVHLRRGWEASPRPHRCHQALHGSLRQRGWGQLPQSHLPLPQVGPVFWFASIQSVHLWYRWSDSSSLMNNVSPSVSISSLSFFSILY